MSPIKEAMELLKATFKDYAGLDGDKETLTKEEIRVLLRCEFTGGVSTKDVTLLQQRSVKLSDMC